MNALGAPLWSALADGWHMHGAVLRGCIVCGAALHATFLLAPARMSVLLPLFALSELVYSPVVPLSDAAVMFELERGGLPATEYGKQRLWGAVSWGYVFAPGLARPRMAPRIARVCACARE